ASRTFEKYSTFSGSGFLAGHDGRQNIPVVRTARKKIPSYEESFARYAPCISLSGGMLFMRPLFLESKNDSTDFLTLIFCGMCPALQFFGLLRRNTHVAL